jgi:tetrahedral aminopeptidase
MAELRDVLERLSNEFGPSGRERAVRNLIRAEIKPLVDRIEVDAMGNLIAFQAGQGDGPRMKVMLSAHMDEVSFMVTEVGKSGLVKFQANGLDARTLLAKRVVIGDNRVPGVIGAPVPHLSRDNGKVLSVDDLSIDIGAADDKAANGKVKVGDYATFATRFTALSADPTWPTVRGKAFDDRAGCTVLIGVLQRRYPVNLYAVFTVQEEVGLRGARVAAYRVEPDAALALEGTTCDDMPQGPGEDRTPVTRIGQGPAISLMDNRTITHPGMLRLLQEAAAAESIPVQYRGPGFGGTDSGSMHLSRGGVPSGTVSVPCRYIHSPAAILNLDDVANAVKLVSAALDRITPERLAR